MASSIQLIPVQNLALMFIPVAVVIVILYRWSLNSRNAIYAVTRMLVQLVLVGYVLTYIFQSNNSAVVILVLSVMLFVASWIALRPLGKRHAHLYGKALLSISLGGTLTLVLVTQVVLGLEPWFWPRYMIPLAGMIYSNAMNSLSLAAERFESEMEKGISYDKARRVALRASLIPITNSLFAVGLVSLPGMMTGQILSGTSPLIAVRYQIMVMCMIFGSAGIASALYLAMLKPRSASNVH
jgi:putative ABC transport system permease protein